MRLPTTPLLPVCAIAVLCAPLPASATPTPPPPARQTNPDEDPNPLAPPDPPGSELSQAGRSIRGVYVPYPTVRSSSPRQLAHWVEAVGATAVILDIKDDRGRVTFTDTLPLASGQPHGEVRRMREIVDALHANGVYVIGRLVCFKDSQLARVRPQAAIKDRRTGKAWRDRGNQAWVDPHSDLAVDHIVSVATAAKGFGFDEIQLDYIRFPVEGGARHAVFPNRIGELARYETIASALARVDHALDLPLSIDVFGLTAYHPGDEDGLGQWLEYLAPYVDAISPMVYLANWPRRYWENPSPGRTHALVNGAVRQIRRRLGEDIAVRPLLQAFAWRAKNYSTAFIDNQIDAAISGGSAGYLFWNQSGNYQKVTTVWQRKSARSRTSALLSPRLQAPAF